LVKKLFKNIMDKINETISPRAKKDQHQIWAERKKELLAKARKKKKVVKKDTPKTASQVEGNKKSPYRRKKNPGAMAEVPSGQNKELNRPQSKRPADQKKSETSNTRKTAPAKKQSPPKNTKGRNNK
jgi:hypothetical protein